MVWKFASESPYIVKDTYNTEHTFRASYDEQVNADWDREADMATQLSPSKFLMNIGELFAHLSRNQQVSDMP